MTTEAQELRWKQMQAGIRKDGTVEGYHVETYAAVIHAMMVPEQFGYEVNTENRFIAFTVDNGGTDLEVRLPFELVEEFAEWMKNPPATEPTEVTP